MFDPDFCNVVTGWEKGEVEKNVQDARRQIWMDAKVPCFRSFEALNVWLEARCRNLWPEVEHLDYSGIIVAEVLEQEPLYLMPMSTPFDGYIEVLARVSSTYLVTVHRKRYSVPRRPANRKVAVHLFPDLIEASSEKVIIARHRRLPDRDPVSYDWLHYLPLIEKMPATLRNGAPFTDMPVLFAQLQASILSTEI